MAYPPTSFCNGARSYCNSSLKGEESDSDDETPELNEGEAKTLYDQWKEDSQSIKIQAIIQTRNPLALSQKLKQCVSLSLSESHTNDANLYLHFIPHENQTVYFAYNQKCCDSTVKIVLLKERSKKSVIAIEKIFIASVGKKQQFVSLNGRLQVDVVSLNEKEYCALFQSAIQELSIAPDSEVPFILKRSDNEFQNIFSLKSLVYRMTL